MSEPWAPASRSLAATRWLDETSAALRGEPIAGSAQVAGSLLRIVGWLGHAISGRASVSGTLGKTNSLQAAAVAGSSTVSGIIGWLYNSEGRSAGTSDVSGELMVGIAQYLEAASGGSATGQATLTIKPYSYISGQQGSDDWGSNENLPPGLGRDSGPTRRRFSPKSIGSTSEKSPWEREVLR